MAQASHALTGSRIRDRRMDLALRQADLAGAVGISPSYLNLIEHNKRRIAGKLLSQIAKELQVEPAQLTDGAERAVLDQMLGAVAGLNVAAETDKVAEMAGRYPGWANVIVAQAQDREGLLARVQSLTDRMAHDPALSAALHAVISAVTSIRSTASILTSGEALDADWLGRFHTNIHDDARRLADHSQDLIRYLDAPTEDQDGALSPFVEMEKALAGYGVSTKAARTCLKEDALSQPAQDLLQAHVETLSDLEKAVPKARFVQAAEDAHYDPGVIARALNQPLIGVMQRLATLSEVDGHPAIGLVTCDAAGAILFRQSAGDFNLPRGGLACPLWPLFTALGQPGRPLQRDVRMPGNASRPMRCFAIAEQASGAGFDLPPVIRATMLVLTEPDTAETAPLPVGPSCRICAVPDCLARREPLVVARDLL